MSIYKSFGSVAQEFNLVNYFIHFFTLSIAKVAHISKTELELGRLLFVTVRSEIIPERDQLSDEVRGPFELKYGPQLLMLWHVYFK